MHNMLFSVGLTGSYIFATLGLHLGFSAKLRIWQVPACKMEPRSGYIMQWGPPTHPTTASVGNQNLARLKLDSESMVFYVSLSPPFMSVPTYFVCPHLYVCPHLLYPSSPIMSVPNHHFNCLQALLKSWSFGECQSASGMFLNGIWTRCVRFNGFFKSQKRSLPKKCFRIHTRLHLGFSAKLKIWQAPGCKMEPQSGIITCNIPTHPPAK